MQQRSQLQYSREYPSLSAAAHRARWAAYQLMIDGVDQTIGNALADLHSLDGEHTFFSLIHGEHTCFPTGVMSTLQTC